MYAHIIESQLMPERLGELDRLVRCELLLPALRAESGFCGAVSLVERERGAALLVLLWETEEEGVRPFASTAPEVREAFSALTTLLGSHSGVIWEVNARS
jgi:hypothetical protein